MPHVYEQLINNQLLQAVKNISEIVNVKLKTTNQSSLPSKISQSPDIKWRNRDINKNFFEGKKNFVEFHKARNLLMKTRQGSTFFI